MTERNTARVDPKKAFFIDVLTMDIDYKSCILDLIDNSVDAFTRLPDNEKTEKEIELTFDDNFFEIRDNCGGINKDDLLETVFRFGGHVEISDQTLGIYGVGLKRAIFKMGNSFEFETNDGVNNSIVYENDLSNWKQEDSEWEFPYKPGEPSEAKFTRLKVFNLNPAYKNLVTIKAEIEDEIFRKYVIFSHRGLAFFVNGKKVPTIEMTLPTNEKLQPAVQHYKVDGVEVKIICGYYPRETARKTLNPGTYGWNVFVNDRLVLMSDTTTITGWGIRPNPAFHQLYYPFAGYVFINSKETLKLPVNTTKNSLVTSHDTYKFAIAEMWKLAMPVLNFIYKDRLGPETDVIEEANKSAEKKLSNDGATKSEHVSIFKPSTNQTFNPPVTKKPTDTQKIAYSKPRSEVETVKKKLKVKSTREVGEKTFSYYYERECGGGQ